nr:hypothetical protein [Myxococcota bacterium]
MNPTDAAPPEPTSSHTETGTAPVTEPMPAVREPAVGLRRTWMALLGSAGEVDALSSELGSGDAPPAAESRSELGRGYELGRKRLWARLEQRAPSPLADDAPSTAATRALLERLRPSEREALVLRFLTGLGVSEIAAVCRSRDSEVENRISRGLSQLAGKSQGETEACRKLESDALRAIENKLSPALGEHLSDCDACRDLKHDLSTAVDRVRRAGDDVSDSPALEQKLNQAIAAQAAHDGAQAREPAADRAARRGIAAKPRALALVVALG